MYFNLHLHTYMGHLLAFVETTATKNCRSSRLPDMWIFFCSISVAKCIMFPHLKPSIGFHGTNSTKVGGSQDFKDMFIIFILSFRCDDPHFKLKTNIKTYLFGFRSQRSKHVKTKSLSWPCFVMLLPYYWYLLVKKGRNIKTVRPFVGSPCVAMCR